MGRANSGQHGQPDLLWGGTKSFKNILSMNCNQPNLYQNRRDVSPLLEQAAHWENWKLGNLALRFQNFQKTRFFSLQSWQLVLNAGGIHKNQIMHWISDLGKYYHNLRHDSYFVGCQWGLNFTIFGTGFCSRSRSCPIWNLCFGKSRQLSFESGKPATMKKYFNK